MCAFVDIVTILVLIAVSVWLFRKPTVHYESVLATIECQSVLVSRAEKV